MSKNVKLLFTLSIVLNVLLLGIGGGFAVRQMHKNPWFEAKRNLSPESQQMMSQSFQKMHQDMEPLMEDMHRTRDDLKKILVEEQFDGNKFDAVSERLRSLYRQMGDEFAATTKSMAAALPVAERQKMADSFVGGFDWKHRKGHGDCSKDHDKDDAAAPDTAKPVAISPEKKSQ